MIAVIVSVGVRNDNESAWAKGTVGEEIFRRQRTLDSFRPHPFGITRDYAAGDIALAPPARGSPERSCDLSRRLDGPARFGASRVGPVASRSLPP